MRSRRVSCKKQTMKAAQKRRSVYGNQQSPQPTQIMMPIAASA